MEPVREIVLMLILRMRAAKRSYRTFSPYARLHPAFREGQIDEMSQVCELVRKVYKLSRVASPHVEEERKRVISISTKREEFVTLADGFVAYWPQGSSNGALSSWHLRVLADELDRRNRAWDAQLQRAFSKRPPEE